MIGVGIVEFFFCVEVLFGCIVFGIFLMRCWFMWIGSIFDIDLRKLLWCYGCISYMIRRYCYFVFFVYFMCFLGNFILRMGEDFCKFLNVVLIYLCVFIVNKEILVVRNIFIEIWRSRIEWFFFIDDCLM